MCAHSGNLWMFCWTVDSSKPTTLEETNPVINLLREIKGSRLSKELEKCMYVQVNRFFTSPTPSFVFENLTKLVPHFWRGIFGNRRKPIVVRRTDAGDSHNKGTLVPSSWLHSINRFDRYPVRIELDNFSCFLAVWLVFFHCLESFWDFLN